MPLLLTILSVLSLWALLTLLVLGLLLILKSLQAIREHLRKINAGVRAIEQETAPLEALAGELGPVTRELHDALGGLARRLREADGNLKTALPALRAAVRR
jgi:uncharacterized MAPEG superfamily protein